MRSSACAFVFGYLIGYIDFFHIIQKTNPRFYAYIATKFCQICRKKMFSNSKFRKLAFCLSPVTFDFVRVVTIFVYKFFGVVKGLLTFFWGCVAKDVIVK